MHIHAKREIKISIRSRVVRKIGNYNFTSKGIRPTKREKQTFKNEPRRKQRNV